MIHSSSQNSIYSFWLVLFHHTPAETLVVDHVERSPENYRFGASARGNEVRDWIKSSFADRPRLHVLQ